jgi:uroporphyrinogen-III decarboxylase
MEREYYIKLANSGLRMPIGADLVLHEKENYNDYLKDGKLLGKVLEETAVRYKTPLAVALMDLMLEKSTMLQMIGISEQKIDTYHFSTVPSENIINEINEKAGIFISSRMATDIGAVEYIAKQTDLVPVGMSIGPFSLLTKLINDPIEAVYLAGAGLSADDDDEIKMVETLLELASKVVLSYIELKIKAGAKAILVAEPAANKVYFSPKQLDEGSDIFERYVMKYNKQIKSLLDKYNVDLIFHCCGDITDYMLKKFTELKPVILSLGSSRVLWEDANIVPKDIVLFGNLPSKRFYSDEDISVAEVERKSCELITNMKKANHPFILGSECDVLYVKGSEKKILAKVDAFMGCQYH